MEPYSRAELVKTLLIVAPGLAHTQYFWATSAGSCIYDATTNFKHVGIKGQRIYFLVADGSDIKRALTALVQRMWLAGYGWIKVSKSGQKLKRTMVDLSLANAVQPDFAAGSVCRNPLVQRSEQKLLGKGGPLDSAAAIPNLTTDERATLAKLYAKEEAAVAEEVKAARELWVKEYGERAVQRAAEAGIVLAEDEITELHGAAVAALDSGILASNFPITLADRTEITVGAILNNPARYHEALCLDPLEPDYDNYRVVGKIFTSGSPNIYSYAHGGQTFKLIRQQIAIEWRNTDSAISVQETNKVLRDTGNFYDYGNRLVHVEGSDIHVLTSATATHYLGLQCRFWYSKAGSNGSMAKVSCDPHDKLVKQLLDLGSRRGLRKLSATSDVPLILPNGKVISTNGFDPETGIIFVINDAIKIPENPTKDDVRQALAFLWHPVSLFPYVDAGARSNCLAALLTAVVRKVVPTALGIAVDAPQRGTGKTKLVRTIMALHCGRNPDLSPLPSGSGRDEELRKKITATLIDGRNHVLFDNIIGNFDSQTLAPLMTSGWWSDRILGKSQEYTGHARLLIGINGNNLSLVGDLPRRFLQIRLDAGMENPFGRHFEFDPEELVLEQREQLVAAAITAISGWFAAGTPDASTATVGSFEDWGTLVRGPLCWFAQEGLLPFDGFRDPMEMLTEAVENDPEQEDFAEFLSALNRILAGKRVTAKELLTELNVRTFRDEDKTIAQEFLTARCHSGTTANNVGKVLNFRRDRAVNGLKLGSSKNRSGVYVYGVDLVAPI
jgi:hypothetical protein